MKVTRTDILLYAIDELKRFKPDEPVTKEMLASSVGLSLRSFNVYISNMAKEGTIKVLKRKFRNQLLANIIITDEGKERLKAFRVRLENLVFTPQRHNINVCLKFNELAGKFKSPLERAFLIYMYKSKESFDLNQYMGNLTTATNDMNLLNFLRKLDRSEDDQLQRSYLLDVFNMTLYGDMANMMEVKKGDLTKEDIDSLLIHAETTYKQGRLDSAEMIYEQLLSLQPNITLNQWLQTNLGLAQVIRRRKGPKEAIDHLEAIAGETQVRLYKALLNQAIGTCYGMMGDYTQAIKLLTWSIKSFQQYKYPLLTSVALNNRGVAYFSSGKVQMAERDWKTALKMADKAGSNYARARALGNLADVEIKNGNFKKAGRYLDSSERLFRSVNDLEGEAFVEFNRALKSIGENELDEFVYHFKRSEEVAYPLPPEYERSFRRRVLAERAKESGFSEAENFIKR